MWMAVWLAVALASPSLDSVQNTPGEVAMDPGIPVFHHADLPVRKRVTPAFPREAHVLDLAPFRHECKAHVLLNKRGVPQEVRVSACPEVFHASTQATLMQWRWNAPRVGGKKSPAQTVIKIRYLLK